MPPKRASLANRIDASHAATPAAAPSALWGEEREQQAVVELEIRQIMPNRRQPRANPTASNLEELAESIRDHGVIQPIIVRQIALTKYEGHGRTYELIAGERRWRASQIAGRTTIPALVRTDALDHRAMIELALIENVQRQDLHPLDEAAAFRQMQEELGYSYAEIAQRIGKSKGYVQNRMRLLQLSDDLRQLVTERPDTIAHVYEIARVEDADARADLIAAVRDDALSRAATRARVEQLIADKTASEQQPEVSAKEEKSYFQKYNRDNIHNRGSTNVKLIRGKVTEGQVFEANAAEKAYFQKYIYDIFHKGEQVDVPQKTSEEVGEQLPEVSAEEEKSYFQKYDRDNIHNQEASVNLLKVSVNEDIHTLETVLTRWESSASSLTPELRAMIRRHIDAVSDHLERIAQKLAEPS